MPEAPQYFSVGLLTDKSVILSWIAGFNGGHQQIFSVQFKTTDDDKQDVHTVHNDGTKTGSTVYYKLDQLKPDLRYQLMVLSGNIHGQRNTSLEFKTKGKFSNMVDSFCYTQVFRQFANSRSFVFVLFKKKIILCFFSIS